VTETKNKKVGKVEPLSSAYNERLEREAEHLLREARRSLKRIERQSRISVIRRPARSAHSA
jgi:outer membrane biosynthesis protein TonB